MASMNIKGRTSGDLNKWMHVPQIIREMKLGLLAIQETHLTEELAKQFEDMFGNNLCLKYSPDPETHNARGVAIVLNKRMIKTDETRETIIIPGRAIMIRIPWQDNGHLNVLAVYAPNPPREIRDFWRNIQDEIDDDVTLRPDIVLGDFNLVEDAIDRIPSKADDPRATEALRDFKMKNNLVDGWRKANDGEKGYTWSRNSDGTQSRIDRIYVNENFFKECSGWNITPAPIPTDHDIVSASISTPSTPILGRGRWAIPPRSLKNREMKKEVQRMALNLQRDIEGIRERTPQSNPQTLLKNFKGEVRETLRKHEKKFQLMMRNKIDKLTEALRRTLNDPALPEDEIRITATHLKKEIQALHRDLHDRNRDRLAAIDEAEGEHIGKTWTSRHKERKPRDTIKCLRTTETGETTKNLKEMTEIAAKYHEKIQLNDHNPREPPNADLLNEILSGIRAKVTTRSKEMLAEQISEEEVREAIRRTNNEKAPGLDGIPIELWRSLDEQYMASKKNSNADKKCDIVWILTQVFQDIELHGVEAGTDFHEGCMCPIYKKKDPDDIANYHPITLLNTDYKVLTKVLSLRLGNVAAEIIHKDQVGFVKERSIFDQVKTSKMVIDYMERRQRSGAIVALDQEKAYNKILHPYLWSVLGKFEILESFTKTIKALYENAKTKVMINGELSEPFTIQRGVRQGDALSCLLFDIAIEPLAESIRRSQNIEGIQIPSRREFLKVKLFADDTTVYLSENDRWDDLQSILSRWCAVSGAKFNIEKTEIIPLGSREQ